MNGSGPVHNPDKVYLVTITMNCSMCSSVLDLVCSFMTALTCVDQHASEFN